MTGLAMPARPARPGAPSRTARRGGAVLRGLSSMTAVNAAKAFVAVLVSVLVAHRVPPSEFGLVAFSVPLLSLVTLLTDLGIASAIVREPTLDRRQAGAATVLMAIAGLAGATLLLLASFPLARALSMHGLGPVLASYAGVAALSVAAAAPRALLERRCAYGRIAAVEGAALALGSASFVLSVGRIGILALVAYQLVLQLVRAVSFLAMARPLFEPNLGFGRVRGLVRIGSWLLLTNLLSYAARNLDNLLVGACLGAASLGVYGLAYQFMTLPLVLITWPASGVLLASLSRLRKEPAAARAGAVLALIGATAAVSFPAMAFLAVGATLPIDLVYAGRWHGLARVVAILAPVGAAQSVASYSGAVLVAEGAIGANAAIGALNGVVLSAVFLLAVWFGLDTLVLCYAGAALVLAAVQLLVTCRNAGIDPRSLGRAVAPGLLASAVGSACFLVVERPAPPGLASWLLASAGFATASLGVLVVFRRRLLHGLRQLSVLGDRLDIAEPT